MTAPRREEKEMIYGAGVDIWERTATVNIGDPKPDGPLASRLGHRRAGLVPSAG